MLLIYLVLLSGVRMPPPPPTRTSEKERASMGSKVAPLVIMALPAQARRAEQERIHPNCLR